MATSEMDYMNVGGLKLYKIASFTPTSTSTYADLVQGLGSQLTSDIGNRWSTVVLRIGDSYVATVVRCTNYFIYFSLTLQGNNTAIYQISVWRDPVSYGSVTISINGSAPSNISLNTVATDFDNGAWEIWA